MNVEEIRSYCLNKKGVGESFPFDAHTLVFKVLGKMFALIALERQPSQINLKCDPERSVQLRDEYPEVIIPGYHMNKKHWNTLMVGQLPPKMIKEMIDHSYEIVVASLPIKTRDLLGQE